MYYPNIIALLRQCYPLGQDGEYISLVSPENIFAVVNLITAIHKLIHENRALMHMNATDYPQFTKVWHPFKNEMHTACAKEILPIYLVTSMFKQDAGGMGFSEVLLVKMLTGAAFSGMRLL
jgi:hypothetical protein